MNTNWEILYYLCIMVWGALHFAYGRGWQGTGKNQSVTGLVLLVILLLGYLHDKDLASLLLVLVFIATLAYAVGRIFVTPPQESDHQ